MESVEKQKQLFPSFHGPLEISPKARDSHIPTAWHAPDGKVGNQNQVSHFPTRGMRRRVRFVCFQNKKPRKEIGRPAASSTSFFRITLDWKRNSVSGSSFDWKMLPAVPLICLYSNYKNFRFVLPAPLSYPVTVGSSVLSTPTGPDPKNKYTEE